MISTSSRICDYILLVGFLHCVVALYYSGGFHMVGSSFGYHVGVELWVVVWQGWICHDAVTLSILRCGHDAPLHVCKHDSQMAAIATWPQCNFAAQTRDPMFRETAESPKTIAIVCKSEFKFARRSVY